MDEQTATEFWAHRCLDCAHPKHPLSGCSEIVGGFAEPDYCPCAAELRHMGAEIERLRTSLKTIYDYTLPNFMPSDGGPWALTIHVMARAALGESK